MNFHSYISVHLTVKCAFQKKERPINGAIEAPFPSLGTVDAIVICITPSCVPCLHPLVGRSCRSKAFIFSPSYEYIHYFMDWPCTRFSLRNTVGPAGSNRFWNVYRKRTRPLTSAC